MDDDDRSREWEERDESGWSSDPYEDDLSNYAWDDDDRDERDWFSADYDWCASDVCCYAGEKEFFQRSVVLLEDPALHADADRICERLLAGNRHRYRYRSR